MKIVSGRVKSGKTRYVVSEYIYPSLINEGKAIYYCGEQTEQSLYDMILDCHRYKTNTDSVLSAENIKGSIIYLDNLSKLPENIENALVVLDRLPEGNFIVCLVLM